MTARPVPRTAEPTVMYAVMTAEPLESEHLLPPPAPELLRRYGTSEISLRRLRSRRHQQLVVRTSGIDQAAFAHRDARVEALMIAEEHDGVVIDLGIPRVVEQRIDDVSLAHAVQWYGYDVAGVAEGRITTIGLAAFGLPEVVVEVATGDQQHAMVSAVLAGLAHRLIAEWPANDPVGRATVTLRDIAYGLGDPAAATTPRERSIEIDVAYDDTEGQLRVHLLADPATTLFAP